MMDHTKAAEKTDKVIQRFETLLLQPEGVPADWLKGVMNAAVGLSRVRDDLSGSVDQRAILERLEAVYDDLEKLDHEEEDVPVQWQSHVSLNLDDLAEIKSWLKGKA